MFVTYKVKDTTPFDFNAYYKALLNNQDIIKPKKNIGINTILLSEQKINDLMLPEKYNIPGMIDTLKNLASKFNILVTKPIEEYYITFQIPKHSGGFRTISAPQDTLKYLLKEALYIFQYKLHALPSAQAYAFTPKRNTKGALLNHQKNQSKWFLKLDIKDFFPSCNFDFIMKNLKEIFPFGYILKSEEGKEALETIIKYSLYNGVLPQGSPLSPILTNLIMIPFDYSINNRLTSEYVYTRYADDILISSIYKFNWNKIENMVKSIISPTFKINKEKTRFGSSAGRNWNLGLMLNRNNDITVGWRNKKLLKNRLMKFILNHNQMDLKEIQQLAGIVAYYKSIEPEYFDYILKRYSTKYNTDIKNLLAV